MRFRVPTVRLPTERSARAALRRDPSCGHRSRDWVAGVRSPASMRGARHDPRATARCGATATGWTDSFPPIVGPLHASARPNCWKIGDPCEMESARPAAATRLPFAPDRPTGSSGSFAMGCDQPNGGRSTRMGRIARRFVGLPRIRRNSIRESIHGADHHGCSKQTKRRDDGGVHGCPTHGGRAKRRRRAPARVAGNAPCRAASHGDGCARKAPAGDLRDNTRRALDRSSSGAWCRSS